MKKDKKYSFKSGLTISLVINIVVGIHLTIQYYSYPDLKKILEQHELWVDDHSKGVRLNLEGANLAGANLQGANLYRANLRRANLIRASIEGAMR